MKGDYMFNGEGKFFVDTGADINIIKSTALAAKAPVKTSEITFMTGVTLTKVFTLGTIDICINGIQPKNPKSVKGFLGITGYYRRFIENYAKIA